MPNNSLIKHIMTKRVLTQIYLDPLQKDALRHRAKERGTTLSEEIRQAVELYLSGITQDEIELLHEFSLLAKKELNGMIETLDACNRNIDEILIQRDKIHGL